MPGKFHYIILYKPFGALSQFTDESGRTTLSEFGPFPRDVYAVGRLDADSEGLLLLTNDNEVKHRMLELRFKHPRAYLAQVEHIPATEALQKLRAGVLIDGRRTQPAEVGVLETEPDLPPRPIPIRYRKTVPTAWLKITLREGRNRQVRKMTAAVGHPTLRLIRIALGNLTLDGLSPGESRSLRETEIADLQKELGIITAIRRNKKPRRAP